MLQIGVQGDDDVAARMLHAGEQRGLLAEITAQRQVADARILDRQRFHDFEGSIRGTIIDIKDFYLVFSLEASQYARKFLVKEMEHFLFLESRANDAQKDGLG